MFCLESETLKPDRVQDEGAVPSGAWMVLFPGVAISIAVIAFNLFGDSLRDYLDPRFKVQPRVLAATPVRSPVA